MMRYINIAFLVLLSALAWTIYEDVGESGQHFISTVAELLWPVFAVAFLISTGALAYALHRDRKRGVL